MCVNYVIVILCIIFGTIIKNGDAYHVEITSTGTSVLGSKINFTAKLMENGKLAPNGKYTFTWTDNADPPHENEYDSDLPTSNWSVVYKRSDYNTGLYVVTVKVDNRGSWFPFPYTIASNSTVIIVTDLLSGELLINQNGTIRTNEYVSNTVPVEHKISLKKSDLDYLINETTYYRTYWFQNCMYLGQTDELNFTNFYTKENEEYEIEALVIGSFDKLPDPITTTTTTTTTTTPAPTTSTKKPTSTTSTTTITPSTTTTTTTTTKKTLTTSIITPTIPTNSTNIITITTPYTTSTNLSQKITKRSVVDQNKTINSDGNKTVVHNPVELEISPSGEVIDVKNITKEIQNVKLNASETATILPLIESNTSLIQNKIIPTTPIPSYNNQPFICLNKSVIPPDPKKVYGYFRKRIIVKVPVANLTVTGRNWLQHGDVLNLQAKCSGSLPLEHCIKIFSGPYNVTGNETCVLWHPLTTCEFPFTHYFITSTMHTVVFVIRNPVAKVVYQVAVNFYEAKKQSQLSVIVVPVSFSLAAVILVVFGVAYYIQNQNRFIVEVADFNFGETQSVDMEYKTFRQRLFDSIRDVIYRRNDRRSDGDGDTNGESSLKYGSMT